MTALFSYVERYACIVLSRGQEVEKWMIRRRQTRA